MNITWDVESTGLLDESAIDYTQSPYVMRDSYKFHCVVVEEHATSKLIAFYDGPKYIFDGRRYEEKGEHGPYVLENYAPLEYEHKSLVDFKQYILDNPLSKVVAHNQINFDLLACKLKYGMDYEVEPDVWCGKQVEFEDTLVLSKTLNPDRFGGHSLDKLSEKVSIQKIEFRKHLHSDVRFKEFAADMLYYCIYDVKANTQVYYWLDKERQGWDWSDAISLEKSVAELITRQTHRGFKFDKELAEKNVRELDALMEERRIRVTPMLPKRPATKGFMKDFTPPARQFKQDRTVAADLVKFAEKIGAELVLSEANEPLKLNFQGKSYDIPLARDPLVTEMDATIDDTTHIKEWLCGLGWQPQEYKEKDLSTDTKKIKLTKEKLEASIDRYVAQTLASNFCDDRCDHLDTTKQKLKAQLLKRAEAGRAIKVLTNPSFTVGQDKEMDPGLTVIAEKFPFVRDVVEYLTYKHRRNSILGGGMEWDEEEEPEKGFIASVRQDGRIPTPADTCGAATSRMKHKLVANIARVTSLYGEPMRAMFCVEDDFFQIGYDFDSLEAREEAHYCWKYEEGEKEYCQSLLMDKPFDVHTMMAKKITAMIKREFKRGPAKNVKYGCLPTDSTLVLTPMGWKNGLEISVGDTVMGYNVSTKQNEWTIVSATYLYEDAPVKNFGHSCWNAEATLDHRWYGTKLKQYGSNKNSVKVFEDAVFTTDEIKQTHNILNTAEFVGGNSSVRPEQAALVAWILSDGYYKWSELSEATSASKGKRKGIVGNIAQASHKFQKEIIEVLKANNIRYKTSELANDNFYKVTSYRLKSEDLRNFFDAVVGCRKQKHEVDWVSWILGLSQESLKSFVHAFWLADGDSKGRENDTAMTFKQLRGNIADALLMAGYLLGYNVTQRGERISNIRFQKKRPYTTTQEFRSFGERKTQVFCLTTELDTFVMKQNGIITITGNCTYGAQAKKVAKTIGSDIKTGDLVFNAFWEAAAPLNSLKKKLATYWETHGGKKFILGIDGRKVPTRSAHAILNSLFQSAGVICAKRAMVIHDRKLKAEGLSVDFFRDDWNKKLFCQQLIAYHDEAQLEVRKELVKFKTFETQEEAQTFKSTQSEIWSDIKDSPKGGVYVGYCRAGELAAQAVKEAGDYYKLNVDLTAGYMIHKNWAGCH